MYGATNYTLISDYKLGKHIGAGAYASVKFAVHRQTGLAVAIKHYHKAKLTKESRKKALWREVYFLRRMKHWVLPKLYDVIETPAQVYLVMECCKGVPLSKYLQKTVAQQITSNYKFGSLPENLVCHIMN